MPALLALLLLKPLPGARPSLATTSPWTFVESCAGQAEGACLWRGLWVQAVLAWGAEDVAARENSLLSCAIGMPHTAQPAPAHALHTLVPCRAW